MCTGSALQIIRTEGLRALCRGDGEQEWVDMSLVGEQAEGAWVLVFLGAAREVISAQRASQINNAIKALRQVMTENQVFEEELFADLVSRTPQLPEHLRKNKQ